MNKTFTFGNKNNTKYTNIFSTGINTGSTTNYSKILDDIILTDIIKKNNYLFKEKNTKLENAKIFLADTTPSLYDAIKFITNYKKYTLKYNLPYTLGKMYTLTDGTPIVFYDDEIQIGFDTYKYSNLSNFSFLNGLNTSTKKTIINIYTTGAAKININLL